MNEANERNCDVLRQKCACSLYTNSVRGRRRAVFLGRACDLVLFGGGMCGGRVLLRAGDGLEREMKGNKEKKKG